MTIDATDAVPASAALAAPCDARSLRDARWATRIQFAALGVVGGAWGVHIPSVKRAVRARRGDATHRVAGRRERRGGLSGTRRAVPSNPHAMFSVGAMAGAGLTGALLRAGVDARPQPTMIGIATAAIVTLAARRMLEAHPAPADDEARRHFGWPPGRLLVVGLMIFAGRSAEGVMYDWCVLYLKQEVRLGQDVAAMGYAAFSAAMAAERFTGDALHAR